MLNSQAKQGRELKELGFDYTNVDHVNLGLSSALGYGATAIFSFEKAPTKCKKEMDQAVVPNMLKTSTQVTSSTPTEDTAVASHDILIQMFPQYEQAGISVPRSHLGIAYIKLLTCCSSFCQTKLRVQSFHFHTGPLRL